MKGSRQAEWGKQIWIDFSFVPDWNSKLCSHAVTQIYVSSFRIEFFSFCLFHFIVSLIPFFRFILCLIFCHKCICYLFLLLWVTLLSYRDIKGHYDHYVYASTEALKTLKWLSHDSTYKLQWTKEDKRWGETHAHKPSNKNSSLPNKWIHTSTWRGNCLNERTTKWKKNTNKTQEESKPNYTRLIRLVNHLNTWKCQTIIVFDHVCVYKT